MTYVSKDVLKRNIEFDGEDFYDINPESKFDTLLDDILERSKAILNGQLNGEGYEQETDRVDVLDAPDKQKIELVYPVDSVSKVEAYRYDTWYTIDSERYHNTEHNLVLDPVIKREYGNYLWRQQANPLNIHSSRVVWQDLGQKVRVTYDRGYSSDNMPWLIKEVQIDIINNMLIHLRQDQNIDMMEPDQALNALNERQIITEDIRQDINKISQTKSKYVVL